MTTPLKKEDRQQSIHRLKQNIKHFCSHPETDIWILLVFSQNFKVYTFSDDLKLYSQWKGDVLNGLTNRLKQHFSLVNALDQIICWCKLCSILGNLAHNFVFQYRVKTAKFHLQVYLCITWQNWCLQWIIATAIIIFQEHLENKMSNLNNASFLVK